jgi:cobalamin biosynthetic protein CobC
VTASWTWHGGGLQAARAHFGKGAEAWLDLSTGINPHAWAGADTIAIDWQRLPEPADLLALERAAAEYFGADAQNVCAVPGTEIGLRLVGDLLGGRASCVVPSYRTHTEMFAGAIPLAAEAIASSESDILILANPNNPDGRVHKGAALLPRSGWLLVDEAFADTDPAISLAGHVSDGRQLVVFRSFGKFFGLAGLRLGFVLGPREILASLRVRLGAWPVSAAAIAIGTAAYRDADRVEAMRLRLQDEAAALDAVLQSRGYNATGHCPLFRLIETEDAAALFERLAQRSILTRPFDYNPRWLRIGLPGSEEALSRLDRALADG